MSTILVAEDEHTSRELLRRMLRQMTTANVVLANNGIHALELYRTTQPIISFLDIQMPEMDGFSVLEQIRGIEPKAFVVMVSGNNNTDIVQQAIKHGVGGYIVKPYSAQRIFDALRRYVETTGIHGLMRQD